jgi:uncharacterized repeat protein (TIGR02543 family)
MKTLTAALAALVLTGTAHAKVEIPTEAEVMGDSYSIIQGLGVSSFFWGEQLIPNGDMLSDVAGFHDIYGWVQTPLNIIQNPSTGFREMFWQNKESKRETHHRVFFSPANDPLQIGDIVLSIIVLKDNLTGPISAPGAWLSKKILGSDVTGVPFKGNYRLYWGLIQIEALNQNFPNKLHFSSEGENCPNGLSVAFWGAKKLVTPDTDGDGLTDLAESLVHNTDMTKADTDGDSHSDKKEVDLGSNPKDANSLPVIPKVRMVYIVPSDREEKTEYKAAIDHAIRDLQDWYGKQLGGPTFRLHDPVIEVIKSDKSAEWFITNPNGSNSEDWGHNNTLQEAKEILGAKHYDSQFIWALNTDDSGSKGRGGSGVAYLSGNNFIGLLGNHPTQKDPLRWIAGIGHEIGHAFGLLHPTDRVKHEDAIMWMGIYNGKYPDTAYLTDEDKQTLLSSRFFQYTDLGSLPQTSEGNGTNSDAGSVNGLQQFVLTATVDGQGSVTGSGTYEGGETSTLRALAIAGHVFNKWTGDANGTSNPLTITVDANKTITANFSQDLNDTDGDGLTNYAELVTHGTQADDNDTDNDGLLDNEEIQIGTDPLASNSSIVNFFNSKATVEKNNARSFGQATGIDLVKANPTNFGLYSSADLNASIANAKSEGETSVTSNPSAFNLVTKSFFDQVVLDANASAEQAIADAKSSAKSEGIEEGKVIGKSEGETSVTSNPSAHNLVTKDTYDQMVEQLINSSASGSTTPFVHGWFYYPNRGWMWTNRTSYPYFYDSSTKAWMYFKSGEDKPKFYHYGTKTWVTLGE